ncbi:hypothetical protein GCM10010129_67230 [Streptomyces fumigatiscleroticus]|nr:hypothetical protein GCM10010129_67230 [Streptomyces fumigatiscleroticus]
MRFPHSLAALATLAAASLLAVVPLHTGNAADRSTVSAPSELEWPVPDPTASALDIEWPTPTP